MRAGDFVGSAGVFVTCLALLLAAGCHSSEGPGSSADRSGAAGGRALTVTGTVRHLDLEGGFYGIEGDDGTKWDPVNLPEDFQKDGVRVRVRVVEVKDRVSTHMWGKLVRILEIKRLPPAGGTPK
jgi:hypothetical protein